MSTTPLPISADLQVGSQNTSSQGGASAPSSASDTTPAAASATQPTRKRKATAQASNSADSHSARRKDAHARLANLLQALDAAAQPPPTYVAPPPPTTHLRYAAIDIWYHIAPTDIPSLPADFDWNQQIAEDVQYQDSRPFRSCKRPSKCEFLRCIPCLKLTCTRERSRMSVGTVESLQVLKHAIRRRRIPGVDNRTLDFMSKLDVPGDEYID